MHPSNLDHKDMQRRGVQTFQARKGRVGSGRVGSGSSDETEEWQALGLGASRVARTDKTPEALFSFAFFTQTAFDPKVC